MAHLPTHASQSPHQNTVKASVFFKRDAAVGLSVEVLLIGPITHYTHNLFVSCQFKSIFAKDVKIMSDWLLRNILSVSAFSNWEDIGATTVGTG